MFKSFFGGVILALALMVNPFAHSQEYKINPEPEVMVNINTATAAEIEQALVGIGMMKSQAIVDFRDKNGKFKNFENLTEVKGIGKSTVEKNRNRIEF